MKATPPVYTIVAVEDEMVSIHRDGVFWATFFAPCPQDAREFAKVGVPPIREPKKEKT